MAYITRQNLIDRFGERRLTDLTDRDGLGVIDEAVLDCAITDAGALIDGYLAGRYSLPLATVPSLLTRLAGDLVFYALHADTVPDKVAADQAVAMKLLGQIALGTVRLGVEGVTAPTEDAQVAFEASERQFTRDSLKAF